MAVFPFLIADIDTNGDGTISPEEQRTYAAHILLDLSLSVDGQPLQLHPENLDFPSLGEMKEGRGQIRIDLTASLPPGGPGKRKLVFQNHHQSRIAAYQVNSLISRDPDIRILAQNRITTSPITNWNSIRRVPRKGQVA